MFTDRTLLRLARELGFVFSRRARHGEIWRHSRTGRIVMIPSVRNTSGPNRGQQNTSAQLRRAAAS